MRVLEVFRYLQHDEVKRELLNGGLEAMLDHFLQYEVDWGALRVPPESTAKAEMKTASLDPEADWWLEVLSDVEAWEASKSRSALVDHYAGWFDRFKGRGQKKNATGLGQWFARHFERGGMPGWPQRTKKGPRTGRQNAWVFPSLADCRRVFDKATGTQNNWEAA